MPVIGCVPARISAYKLHVSACFEESPVKNARRLALLSLVALMGTICPIAAPGSAFGPAAAWAQPKSVESYIAIVTRDEAPLRCGAAVLYYPVTNLKAGTLIRVDGEDAGFVRVSYPEGLKAYVKAEDLKLESNKTDLVGGETVRGELIRPSRLRAANLNAGDRGSWYPLLDAALDPGTKLTITQIIKGDDGKPGMYAVVAPSQARGYVSRESVRKATPEEAKSMSGAADTAPTSTSGSTTSRSTTSGSAAPGTTPPANTSAGQPLVPPPIATPGTGTNAPAGGGTQPAAGTQPSAPTPVPGTTPVNSTPATGTDGPKPAPITPPATSPTNPSEAAPTTTVPPQPMTPVLTPPEPLKPSKAQQLVDLFETVRKQPLGEAELDQAIAAFESHITTLDASAAGQREARVLERYVSVLKARRELRDTVKQSDSNKQQLNTRNAELAKQIAELEKQAIYKAIGRLVPSTVYDGTVLPKLYRLVSPEPGTARTLGYLAPAEGLDLEAKLGRIIGVVGEERMDAGLNAIILLPRRVDVLNMSVATSTPTPTPAAAPVAPTPTPDGQP